MTKSELIERIAAKLPNLTLKEVDRIVNVIFERLTAALVSGDRVEIRGFGAFSIRTRKPRVAINPKNKVKVQVPEKNIIHFKTGKELHNRLNP
ncbi:MAG: integration host factor subunit beta [Alphaproteobacteria bacterium]|nr:integration host factor subunit beta [Alphaproteobacteria bacterium]